MQKKLLALAILLAITIPFTSVQAKISHGIGIDLVRMLDTNQNPKFQGMNINYQISVTAKSGVYIGYAYMHPYTTHIVEAGWKYYIQKYLNGLYIQLGANYWVAHDKEYKLRNSLAADVRIGYEYPLTDWMVLSGGVSAIFGPPSPTDTAATTKETYGFFFRPHLGFIFHF